MEREIAEQPRVLAENSARYLNELNGFLADKRFDMALLVARGSSDNAALYARYLIEIHLGIPVSLSAPSVITRYKADLKYPKCLAIGISQSGAAPDVSEVIAHLRSQGHTTLALTNTVGSHLGSAAEHCLLLGAGGETSVAATKTYTATLLALYQLVRALGGGIGEPVLPSDASVRAAHDWAAKNLGPFLRSQTIFALARGYRFCSAHETALKLMECALMPCKSYSTADFEHGPKALAIHGTATLVFGEAPSSTQTSGTHCVVAPSPPDPLTAPIFDALAGQWLALLAARARGLDPDSPQGLSKITKTI